MAGEVSKRTWYLVVRRDGFDPQVIKLPIILKQTGRELDGLVENVHQIEDPDLMDDASVIAVDDRDLVMSYEFHALTAPWEVNEITNT